MKFRIHKALAVVAAVAILAPVAAALADTVPVPALPPLPTTLPLPITIPGNCPTTGTKPPGCIPALPPVTYPNPQAFLAMLQGQIDLIAGALGTTPQYLLAKVLGTEIPSEGSLVMTVNDLLNRISGTTLFDATSNAPLGTTEIAIGNVSHGFNMGTLAKTAIDGPACVDPALSRPCVEAPNPWVATLPTYTKVTSNWLPTLPAESVLGTSILLPLVNGLTPAPPATVPATPVNECGTPTSTNPCPPSPITDVPVSVCVTAFNPQLCQGISALIKANIILVSEPGGQLVNIQGGGWTVKDPVTGLTVKKGVHNGGTGTLNGTNLDTGYRGIASLADPSPVWLPLLTSTIGLTDSSIDFLGFSPSAPTVANSCTNNKDTATPPKTIPTTYSVVNGHEIAHFPASTCKSSGSFSGFGIALYGPSEGHAPVNFRTDLAPLWDPAPPAVNAVSNAVAAVLAALNPYLPPAGLGLLTYPPVTFGLGLVGVVTGLEAQILAAAGGVPALPAIPPSGIPTLPALPPGLPALPPGLPTLP